MKTRLFWLPLVGLFALAPTAQAGVDVSFGMRVPGLSIGINMPSYPSMVLVPGLPVYYSPESDSNYFYYDGLYWSYQDDYWYTSDWYDGPWISVSPYDVPLYILRVPVRYYVRPPHFFVGWRAERAPHWGEHWGRNWQRGHRGWDQWDRGRMPQPAPLPNYQRSYHHDNYPRSAKQEYAIRSEHFSYRPHDDFNRRYLNRPQPVERVQLHPREDRRQTDARPDRRPQMPLRNSRQQPEERVHVIRPQDNRRQLADERVKAKRPQMGIQNNMRQPDARSRVRPDANRQQPNMHRLPQEQQAQPDRRHNQPNRQSRPNGRRQDCNSDKQNSNIRCKVRK